MFSLDALIIASLPVIWKFLLANKFSVLAIFYALEKGAKLTKTTIDDSILTFLKNTALRGIGKGGIVDQKYEFFKRNGLINKVDPGTIEKFEEEFNSIVESNKEKSKIDDTPKRSLGTPTMNDMVSKPYVDKIVVEGEPTPKKSFVMEDTTKDIQYDTPEEVVPSKPQPKVL